MSINLPSHYVKQYATNIELLLQQTKSKLEPYVTMGSYKGESASPVDQIGSIEMQDVVARFAPMGRVDAAVDRRWVAPSDFELPQLIDSFDKLKLLLDPSSMYVQNAVAAANRKKDSVILAAYFAANSTGKTGSTSTSFTSANAIAVNYGGGANTGLTIPKLRQAKKLLMAAEVDLDSDQLVCPITATQHDNLLSEIQVISLDFNEKPVMMEGKITRFLGINFIHCERVPVDGSSYRRVPVWAKSGVHLGMWQDIQNSISVRHDLSGEPWQAYTKLSVGATRLQEAKCIEIKCSEV